MSEQYKIDEIDERIKNLQSEIDGCKIIRQHLVDDLKKKEENNLEKHVETLLKHYLENNYNIISKKDYKQLSNSDKYFWRYNYKTLLNNFCKKNKDITITKKLFFSVFCNMKPNNMKYELADNLIQHKGLHYVILQTKDIVIKTIKCKECLNSIYEHEFKKHSESKKCMRDTIELLKTKKLLGITNIV